MICSGLFREEVTALRCRWPQTERQTLFFACGHLVVHYYFYSSIQTFNQRFFLDFFSLLEERMRAPLPPLMSKTEARSSHTGNNAAFFLPLAVFSLLFFFFYLLLFMCQKIGIPVILKHSWTAPFFSSLDPWKDVINNKVPQERAMINFSFWPAMASTPPRCLRETAPAFLFLHLLSFLDPSQHHQGLSVSAVTACVNTPYMNKKRVCVWFRFTRRPSSGRIQNQEVFDCGVATSSERPS